VHCSESISDSYSAGIRGSSLVLGPRLSIWGNKTGEKGSGHGDPSVTIGGLSLKSAARL